MTTHFKVHREVVHPPFPFRFRPVYYLLYVFLGSKELYEGFLVNIPPLGSPPNHRIGRLRPIHCGLGPDGPPPSFCEFLELGKNNLGFIREGTIGEWCVRNFGTKVSQKHRGKLVKRGWSPPFRSGCVHLQVLSLGNDAKCVDVTGILTDRMTRGATPGVLNPISWAF